MGWLVSYCNVLIKIERFALYEFAAGLCWGWVAAQPGVAVLLEARGAGGDYRAFGWAMWEWVAAQPRVAVLPVAADFVPDFCAVRFFQEQGAGY